MGCLIQRMPVFICLVRQRIGIRLISQAPHHHAGMVPVPVDHLFQHLQVIFPQIPSVMFIRPHADCRGFIHDHNAFPVTQLIHLFRIGIMACTETVCVQPVIKIDIRNIQAWIRPPSVKGTVFMLAWPMEPERSSVDQEARAVHPGLPDSERLLIQVFPICDPGSIQIGCPRPRFPQAGLPDLQNALLLF